MNDKSNPTPHPKTGQIGLTPKSRQITATSTPIGQVAELVRDVRDLDPPQIEHQPFRTARIDLGTDRVCHMPPDPLDRLLTAPPLGAHQSGSHRARASIAARRLCPI